ncbi:MAG: prepilin-type N-terminal cleavage/methylation domain-containing protein [bacterium]
MGKRTINTKYRAFTLIELLIVVAIIGILAAIAVPNFLNAQLRAKIARVHSDQKSFADALEMYFIDNAAYPWTDANPHGNNPIDRRWIALTTPVAYINTLAYDPFGDHEKANVSQGCPVYVTYDSWIAMPYHGHFDFLKAVAGYLNTDPYRLRYAFVSQGPDKKIWACNEVVNGHMFYDSSNGLISIGDILRAGPGTISEGGR